MSTSKSLGPGGPSGGSHALLHVGEDDERVLLVGAFDPQYVAYSLAATAIATLFLLPIWPLLLPLCYIAIRASFRSWEFRVT